ncbi:hypothetical protein CCYS_02100 [Corynebacterium cystitidis DSM 20524]|uniref:Uncharacterized protein n=1 Tax=Corynebacterium cystitidis DSM 20524 TaxID=1121357 RepID=A0A1H9VGZ5_9CORY|nr:hypothetical protein CCYS_02100 [Corynebacterium cystitidis DSM 20524]SES20922.1 hypothetical protein SAMN05661109_02233 [Corynebacterium cystitidis DSM 20524]SNV87867.1 Uncharacterised protein [Corynebacterium cystitidis]
MATFAVAITLVLRRSKQLIEAHDEKHLRAVHIRALPLNILVLTFRVPVAHLVKFVKIGVQRKALFQPPGPFGAACLHKLPLS